MSAMGYAHSSQNPSDKAGEGDPGVWDTGAMAVVLLRCSDGHLFAATRLKLLFLSVHLIDVAWLRCPVDHKWRIAEPLRAYKANALSEAEIDEAMRRPF
jgi:hypothetical protein